VVITGGVAKNTGEYKALKMPLQTLKAAPQTNGALGAAVLTREALKKRVFNREIPLPAIVFDT